MTPLEAYDLKRRNFIETAQAQFRFLTDSLHYSAPELTSGDYSDSIRYVNKQSHRRVTLYNAYHPVDYGFELRVGRIEEDRVAEELMWAYVLKEDQDTEQSYLYRISEKAREELWSVLAGAQWLDNN